MKIQLVLFVSLVSYSTLFSHPFLLLNDTEMGIMLDGMQLVPMTKEVQQRNEVLQGTLAASSLFWVHALVNSAVHIMEAT